MYFVPASSEGTDSSEHLLLNNVINVNITCTGRNELHLRKTDSATHSDNECCGMIGSDQAILGLYWIKIRESLLILVVLNPELHCRSRSAGF